MSMSRFRYDSDEARVFPHILIAVDEDGQPIEYLSHEPLRGDVIEAVSNPGETYWTETDESAGLVPRPDPETVADEVPQPRAKRARKPKAPANPQPDTTTAEPQADADPVGE